MMTTDARPASVDGPDAGQRATVEVTDREGRPHVVEVLYGETLMSALKYRAQLNIEATCGGNAICGTCHVYVDEESRAALATPSEDEVDLLDQLIHAKDGSRLACQLTGGPSLVDVHITLAPHE